MNKWDVFLLPNNQPEIDCGTVLAATKSEAEIKAAALCNMNLQEFWSEGYVMKHKKRKPVIITTLFDYNTDMCNLAYIIEKLNKANITPDKYKNIIIRNDYSGCYYESDKPELIVEYNEEL